MIRDSMPAVGRWTTATALCVSVLVGWGRYDPGRRAEHDATTDPGSGATGQRAGIYLGTVVVPARFDRGRGSVTSRMRARPVFTDDAACGVVKDSTTGVQRVARFSYEPHGQRGAGGAGSAQARMRRSWPARV